MKVQTITCHDVYNTGASLQAYALARYIRSCGHDVRILDYKPAYLSGHYRLWGGVSPKYNKPLLRTAYSLAKLPMRIIHKLGKRKREFDRFTQRYLPLSEKRYHSYQELLNEHEYTDAYIAGSDQIWNTLFENGKDPAFYLRFVPEGVLKASYAASFATEKIQGGWEAQVAEWLRTLDYVSVREESGLRLLQEMGIEHACRVVDPVFLLNADDWSSLACEWKNPNRRPYVIVYDFDRNPHIAEWAQQLAKKNNWELVSFLRNPYIRRDYSQEGPLAFLSLIRHAQAVVSNSFHATAFSLIFGKEFWVFDRREGINTRMHDLVALAGHEERIVSGAGNTDYTPLDYDCVHRRLNDAIHHSMNYLNHLLGERK